jgi:hypothetical protein
MTQYPSIGRIVVYRSRTGDYDIPAIINCTVDTLNAKGVELGHVPALSSDMHVHSTVSSAQAHSRGPAAGAGRPSGNHASVGAPRDSPISSRS